MIKLTTGSVILSFLLSTGAWAQDFQEDLRENLKERLKRELEMITPDEPLPEVSNTIDLISETEEITNTASENQQEDSISTSLSAPKRREISPKPPKNGHFFKAPRQRGR